MSSNIFTEWTQTLSSSASGAANAITTGSDGLIYIAGETWGDLDGQTNNGIDDAFISKYNPDGTKDWTKLLGSDARDSAHGITTGNDGSIYIAGYTSGDLDGQTNNGDRDAFISKYNPDGSKEWTKLLGTSSSEYAIPLTTGSGGSIYIAGYTNGDLDGETNSGTSGTYDAFISKYNPDGTKEWTKLLGSAFYDVAHALTTGSGGSIYIAGYTQGDLDGQTNNGNDDAFISKYNPDGTKEWTKLLGSDARDVAHALTTGSDGSIYIAGYTYGDLDGQTNSGSNDAFISKYNPDGTKDWTKLLGSASHDYADALTTDSDGSIYIAGETWGDLDGQTNSGSNDAFISKITNLFSPTDISLSSSSFNENIDAASTVATLSTTDANASDTHAYTLVSGTGDTDNDAFKIDGSNLKINSSPDYETQSSYSIRLKTTDSAELTYERTVELIVEDLNETPIGINISKLEPMNSIGFDIHFWGEIQTVDQDNDDQHIYTLVSEEGDNNYSSNLSEIDSDNVFALSFKGYPIEYSEEVDSSKFTYKFRLRSTDLGGLSYEQSFIWDVNSNIVQKDNSIKLNDVIEDGIEVAQINNNFTPDARGFSSINAPAPVTVTAYEVGTETTLDSIKDFDGNLHAGDNLEETASSYKYQGMLDVNGDGVFEAIFTNKVSKRWVTAKVDSTTGQIDFDDNGAGGGTRVVGIYEDPLIAEGSNNGGFLSDGVTPAPANFGVAEEERYVEVNGENIDRLALNSQVRFQNDLDIDNLSAKHSGDYDSDGVSEVYWKTNDGTAYLRALMHDDGNIRYANYQSEDQMSSYLTAQGHAEIVSDIV